MVRVLEGVALVRTLNLKLHCRCGNLTLMKCAGALLSLYHEYHLRFPPSTGLAFELALVHDKGFNIIK